MSNHIDDLLKDMDEVLNLMSSPKKPNKNEELPPPKIQKSPIESPHKKKDDLDSLLDEMMGLGEEAKWNKSNPQKITDNNSQPNNQPKTSKCFQILLSNEEKVCCKTEAFKGQLICDKLRCMNCDRKVNSFKGFCFAADCDYLFFRNYSLDSEQIKKKLIKNSNFGAYYCQCSWISIDKTINIRTEPQLKWVCSGGH